MNIVLPSMALKLIPFRPRWIVVQANSDGKVLYAQTFVTRNGAEQAAKAANERMKFWTTRLKAEVARLPHDIR